jgi:hypothetical protein
LAAKAANKAAALEASSLGVSHATAAELASLGGDAAPATAAATAQLAADHAPGSGVDHAARAGAQLRLARLLSDRALRSLSEMGQMRRAGSPAARSTHAVEVDGARPLVGEQRHNTYAYPISDLHSTQEQQQQEHCRQQQSIK